MYVNKKAGLLLCIYLVISKRQTPVPRSGWLSVCYSRVC